MNERIIPIADVRRRLPTSVGVAARPLTAGTAMVDMLDRPLRDLRISVTDRCNFRCTYCMPKEVFDRDYQYLPHRDLLSFEEVSRLANVFVGLGVTKIRLTGGEPLLRKGIETLIEQLAQLRTPAGEPLDLTLTTNGALLERKAAALAAAGLKRVTVSLDALDDAIFRRMNDVEFPVRKVLDGIDAAAAAGLAPIKINMVVQRGVNDHQVLAMAERFRHSGHVLRFIEYMDVGSSNGWKLDEVVPSRTLVERIGAVHPIHALSAHALGETAERWAYDDGAGELGFISSVSHAFCGECTRARLSTDGRLFTCLFATEGWDLRSVLRQDADDGPVRDALAAIWSGRTDRYSELRGQVVREPEHGKVEMSFIGG
ncbi:GTP 3',8-cyclase MoaA [soil metagenome]